jgi:hypothetical protein
MEIEGTPSATRTLLASGLHGQFVPCELRPEPAPLANVLDGRLDARMGPVPVTSCCYWRYVWQSAGEFFPQPIPSDISQVLAAVFIHRAN